MKNYYSAVVFGAGGVCWSGGYVTLLISKCQECPGDSSQSRPSTGESFDNNSPETVCCRCLLLLVLNYH